MQDLLLACSSGCKAYSCAGWRRRSEGCLSFPTMWRCAPISQVLYLRSSSVGSKNLERQLAQGDSRGGCLPFPKMFADVGVRVNSEMLYLGLKSGQFA